MKQFALTDDDINLISVALAHHAIGNHEDAARFNNERIRAVFDREADRALDLRDKLRGRQKAVS